MHKEHEEFYAEQYRAAQAHKMLRLFKQAKGRDCGSTEDLEEWYLANKANLPPGPITPDPEDFDAVRNGEA